MRAGRRGRACAKWVHAAFVAATSASLTSCPGGGSSHEGGAADASLPQADSGADSGTPIVDVGMLDDTGCASQRPPIDVPTFHGDRGRLGWNAQEQVLTPEVVAGPSFGAVWSSPAFDPAVIDGVSLAAHVYGSPLYLDDVAVTSGPYTGAQLSLVYVATTSGYVYAVNAFDTHCHGLHAEAGAIVWRAQMGVPIHAPMDGDRAHGGMPLGALSTPIIDRSASPPRIYVVSIDAGVFRAYAFELESGRALAGWPVALDAAAIEPVNENAPQKFSTSVILSQRGALNLSPDGGVLYVPFGAYGDGGVGWMVAIDTKSPSVLSSFAGANAATPLPTGEHWVGGVWSPGGASVDADGSVYATTGNSPTAVTDVPGVWGQTLLRWSPKLQLTGTYTPFNYHLMDIADTDLGGSAPVLLPDLDPTVCTTRRMITFGGKQGNVYLLDREHLPGGVTRRPPSGGDSSSDRSMLPPGGQPQFAGARGPLNVFGPYSETYGNIDHAKMRTTPAYYRGADGSSYLFVSGATKATVDSQRSVPPCVARLRIVTSPDAPAYLAIDDVERTLSFLGPGSPVVSSDGPDHPIVWVLDENAVRFASLTDPSSPHPILHAIDGLTMKVLWRSPNGELSIGGKYNSPTVVHGIVLVATDRIQAYGVKPR